LKISLTNPTALFPVRNSILVLPEGTYYVGFEIDFENAEKLSVYLRTMPGDRGLGVQHFSSDIAGELEEQIQNILPERYCISDIGMVPEAKVRRV